MIILLHQKREMMKNITKVLASLAFMALLVSPALGAKKVKWKLAMTWPKTLAPLATPPQKLAELVKKMSGGNFTIKVHGKGIHKAPLGILI